MPPLERRGTLRVYLGAAPGVGKTYAMLGEGHRREQRGVDVVAALVVDHGRPQTAAMADGLEAVPTREVIHRGVALAEMDLPAVLKRRPAVALVDELAHTNAPGVEHAKRWQDVQDLLDAGIDVVTTVNIQHLESLNDVVSQITGIEQRETVPDEVVRAADQIELVDMSPQALRRRLAHGNVYSAEKVDAALSNYFREGNLTALRELALLWVADRVDDALQTYRGAHGISTPWPARERVVVALTGGPEGDTLLRRAARIVSRGSGGELLACFVARGDGLSGPRTDVLDHQRRLTEDLGGTFHVVMGDDVPQAILDFAQGVNASTVVVGSSRRHRWSSLLGQGTGQAVIAGSGDIDVHVVTHDFVGRGRRQPVPEADLGRRRLVVGWLLALLGVPALTAALVATPMLHDLPTELMLHLALVVVVSLVGGRWPAVVASLSASLQVNFFFTEPVGSLSIADGETALAVVVFVLVAVSCATVVDTSARRQREAALASSESAALAALAGTVLRGENDLPTLLGRLREMLALDGAAVLEQRGGEWSVVAASGDRAPTDPDAAQTVEHLDEHRVLALTGRVLPASDRRLLTAFSAQAESLLDRQHLADEAADARRAAEVGSVRAGLLAAVSHDLRTPLAGIKAAVSALRSDAVTLSTDDQSELLATVEESADRLTELVSDLLDLTRLRSGSIGVNLAPTAIADVLHAAMRDLPVGAVRDDLPTDVPLAVADPVLLERVLANLLGNAVRYAPADQPTRVTGCRDHDEVMVRVSDRGPGVQATQRDAVFEPFQRLGDAPDGSGVGLGLALARGFTEAMHGSLEVEDTPGGGLTAVVRLPLAHIRVAQEATG